MKKSLARRRLLVEGLERRELLAGNVLVAVTNGSVTVTGDETANRITITQQANGRFTIAGLDEENITGPTTDLVIRNLTVNLLGGDDVLLVSGQEIGDVTLPAQIIGTTRVNGGDGADLLNVSVVGRQVGTFILPAVAITIDGGAVAAGSEDPQDDTAILANSAGGIVTVRTGVGNDIIDINNLVALNLNVESGGSNGATDIDVVGLTAVAALNATINLGRNSSGNTLDITGGLFGTLQANGGNGTDTVLMNDTLGGLSLTLNTYDGADFVNLTGVRAGLTSADYVELANLVIQSFDINLSLLPFDLLTLISRLPALPGFLTISTGEGDDIVTATDLVSTLAIYMYLDGGDDRLTAAGVDSTIAFFFGGAGNDERLVTDVTALSELELQFETLLPQAPST